MYINTKIAQLLLFCLFCVACSKQPEPDPNRLEQFTLQAKNSTYIFNFPARYHAEQSTPELIYLRCIYPTMEPNDSAGRMDSFNIQLDNLRVNSRIKPIGYAQSFINNARQHPELFWYAGKEGPYDLYQTKNVVSNQVDTYYVFTASDGQLVLVEPWHFYNNHRIVRYFDNNIDASYLVSGGVGSNFVKIDEEITAFIKSHLTILPTQH